MAHSLATYGTFAQRQLSKSTAMELIMRQNSGSLGRKDHIRVYTYNTYIIYVYTYTNINIYIYIVYNTCIYT